MKKCNSKCTQVINQFYGCGCCDNDESVVQFDDYIVGEETLTNKRYNGKPIYRKLVDFGKLPQVVTNGVRVNKIVDSGLTNADCTVVYAHPAYYTVDGLWVTQSNNGSATPAYGGYEFSIKNGDLSELLIYSTNERYNDLSAIITIEYYKNN